MRTIWKFPLGDPGDLHWIDMPAGARVVAAAIQHNAHVCWAEVDDEEPLVATAVHTQGTGWPVPEDMYGDDVRLEHRATFQQGPFVWHVWQGVVRTPEVPW